MTVHIWKLVTLISLGGCFELYDLFLTAYIAPGLSRAGYFTPASLGAFNILGPIEGASALDLFAGSGSLGLEAISRGAGRCVFVEKAPPGNHRFKNSLRWMS